ncbi:gamma-glutamyltransferase [Salipaludibacillus keqinensis]|uniref:Gamma-glutamyltransferase n=1 Tax=Salipaludibacillus keqinensis TaxID=2045207 RepID=A0A323TDV2_9BACI|nr:gamma-glutamyltransferase [Salipaludibacillus keqinensis]PYZ92017.1 gamma-glutamyltransferase [Salipaludibacillus keqinensis]
MNYKGYLKVTHLLAGVIFIGLVAWNLYFEGEFDQYREPYSGSDFQDRQVDSVSVGQDTSENVNNNNAENNSNLNNDEEAAIEEERVGVYGVSSIHPLAADIGMKIIEDGGNAVDAAVAVSFMLNVVEPYGSGIGGGGLMLVHDPEQGAVTYDYREAAPLSGGQSFAVPGLVKGMEKVHQELGSGHENASWDSLLAPAIEAAEEGFQVGEVLHEQIANSTRYVQFDEEDAHIRELYYPEGQAIQVNDTLVQQELADTLAVIQENGAAGFYEGEIGDILQNRFEFTSEDLTSYEAQTTETVSAELGSQIVHGGPSPSSGTVVVQALQMADQFDLQQVLTDEEYTELQEKLTEDGITDRDAQLGDLMNYEEHQHQYIHLITEITRATYSSRLDTLGDPEFETIDHSEFTTNETVETLLQQIYDNNNQASAGETAHLYDSPGEQKDSRLTTHFVIVDKEGRMVSATHSLGQFFGAGRYKNGIFINSQMENFSDNPESPNSYEPGKRPRTFVAPMIFEEQDQAVLGIGSPGGRRIPAMVFQTIMRYQHGLNEDQETLSLQEAIQNPRFYTEDGVVHVEARLEEEVTTLLRGMNYSVLEHGSPLFYGGIQGLGVVLDENGRVEGMYGGGDPRRRGSWQIEVEE